MNNNIENVVSLFGVDILNFDDYDVLDDGSQYYRVSFHLSSLKELDGSTVHIDDNYFITIYDEDGIKKLKEFSLIDNVDFKQELYERHYKN